MSELVGRRVGFRQCIGLGGRLDGPLARSAIEAFWDAVESGAQEIWLDVTDVSTVDPSGAQLVGTLVDSAHELERRLVVICPNRALRHRLAVGGCAGDGIADTVTAANHDRFARHSASPSG